MKYELKITLGWFDLDELPALREYTDEFASRFTHSGLHTGTICVEGVDLPSEDGELTLRLGWVDLDDVPKLIEAVGYEFCFDGDASGAVCVDRVEFA